MEDRGKNLLRIAAVETRSPNRVEFHNGPPLPRDQANINDHRSRTTYRLHDGTGSDRGRLEVFRSGVERTRKNFSIQGKKPGLHGEVHDG